MLLRLLLIRNEWNDFSMKTFFICLKKYFIQTLPFSFFFLYSSILLSFFFSVSFFFLFLLNLIHLSVHPSSLDQKEIMFTFNWLTFFSFFPFHSLISVNVTLGPDFWFVQSFSLFIFKSREKRRGRKKKERKTRNSFITLRKYKHCERIQSSRIYFFFVSLFSSFSLLFPFLLLPISSSSISLLSVSSFISIEWKIHSQLRLK